MKAYLYILLLTFPVIAKSQTVITEVTTDVIEIVDDTPVEPSLPDTTGQNVMSHFAWGADIGSTIDMTGQEMTTFDITAQFGYKGAFMRFAGIGAGIKTMVSNSSRAYPVYAVFRTSFTSQPSLCFIELKGGYQFVNLYDTKTQRQPYLSVALGFTLARGVNFRSHITAGYEYTLLDDVMVNDQIKKMHPLHCAALKIGVSF